MTEWKSQKIVAECDCPDALVPFILRKLNDALLTFESVQKPRIYRARAVCRLCARKGLK